MFAKRILIRATVSCLLLVTGCGKNPEMPAPTSKTDVSAAPTGNDRHEIERRRPSEMAAEHSPQQKLVGTTAQGATSATPVTPVASTSKSSEQPKGDAAGENHEKYKLEIKAKEAIVTLPRAVRLELVVVPAGEFVMGDDHLPPPASPAHRVRISKPFYIGKYEVTEAQWAAVMGLPAPQGSSLPRNRVSWNDCQVFIRRLNEGLGPAARFSLPTEGQWEYACRAGSTGRYQTGDDEAKMGEYAWYMPMPQSASGIHPVGQLKPNAWGIYDMCGNVAEWCNDAFSMDYYRDSPIEDPPGPAAGGAKVVRGFFGDDSYGGRSLAQRAGAFGLMPAYGFRVAMIPSQ